MELSNAGWRKSSRSGTNGGACVELARTPGGVATRDSKASDGGTLAFSVAEMARLLADIRDGRYDL